MRWQFFLTAVSLFILSVTAAVPPALAQAGTDIFVTPIPNAPFTGTINVERSFVQRDGAIIQSKTIRDIGRDSRGRIFNQSRTLVPITSSETPELVAVNLYDQQTRTSTMVFTRDRTYAKATVNRPPETTPPALLASSAANSLPRNEFAREEDLGTRQMEGVGVHGVRETQTIPAENGGKEVVITDEYWYSEDLRINLMIKHNDPRTGGFTMTVTQVKRTEPNPALFDVPEGYTLRGAQPKAQQ